MPCRAGVTLEPQGPTGRPPKGRWKVSLGPLSYSWCEQSGQRGCSQIYFAGCSQGNTLLRFLRVPNRKASIPEASSLTSPCRGSHRPARADEAGENTWFFQAIPDPVRSARLQAARVLDAKTKQPRKEGGHLWVPLAAPGCPRPLPPAKDRVGDWRWLLPPDTPLTLPLSQHELQKPDSQDPPSALPGVPPRGPVASARLQRLFLPLSQPPLPCRPSSCPGPRWLCIFLHVHS